MRLHPALLTLALLAAAAPLASAHGDAPSFRVDLDTLAYDGPPGLATLVESTPGERYAWDLNLTANYTVGAFHLGRVFDVARPQQVVPTLQHEGTEYPLFELFPGDDITDVDSPARVYRYENASDGVVLHLGFPGAERYNRTGVLHARLTLQRDVTPPRFESLGASTNVTARGFYRETRTDEFALVDLQVRPNGTTEWVRNPTAIYHYLQKFPVLGLDPERDYDVRLVATDWAGNENATTIERLRTPAPPALPQPRIDIVSPTPNATLPSGEGVTLQARVDLNTTSSARSTVRLFFDKHEVTQGWALANGTLTYAPGPLDAGHHTWSIEAINPEGGSASARGAFDVAQKSTPGAPPLAALLVAALLTAAWDRARRSR